jgi:hypothetical protein
VSNVVLPLEVAAATMMKILAPSVMTNVTTEAMTSKEEEMLAKTRAQTVVRKATSVAIAAALLFAKATPIRQIKIGAPNALSLLKQMMMTHGLTVKENTA